MGTSKLLSFKELQAVHLIIVFIIIGSFAGSSSDVTTNAKCKGLYSFVDFKASAVCYINPLITGRYVGIMTTKSQILQLCEVEVYSRGKLIDNRYVNDQVHNKVTMDLLYHNDVRKNKIWQGKLVKNPAIV